MKVLVGCEESGVVRDEFIKLGHDAWSNDLIDARNGGPHLKMCVKEAIIKHGPWDIIILHPDCTYMAVCANRWYGIGKEKHHKRLEAIDWTIDLWEIAVRHAKIGCALENPVSVIFTYLKEPQYIHPWQFGHKETKKTGIKLHNLPKLQPTNVVGPPPHHGNPERKKWERVWRMAKSDTRKRDRSQTFHGIGQAMAQQWGNNYYSLEEMMQ